MQYVYLENIAQLPDLYLWSRHWCLRFRLNQCGQRLGAPNQPPSCPPSVQLCEVSPSGCWFQHWGSLAVRSRHGPPGLGRWCSYHKPRQSKTIIFTPKLYTYIIIETLCLQNVLHVNKKKLSTLKQKGNFYSLFLKWGFRQKNCPYSVLSSTLMKNNAK